MHCPFCDNEETRVIDSRLAGEGRLVRRRRECLGCTERFTTYETPELVLPNVVKRDKTRVPFDEGKLRKGITRATEKRPVDSDDVEAAVQELVHLLSVPSEVTTASLRDRLVWDPIRDDPSFQALLEGED